ncbi:MAG TPA: hypothetical protein VFR38_15005 [Gaiellaceae bacterium]|nr:hypothetical protein [Gaiellaceae bacterium]
MRAPASSAARKHRFTKVASAVASSADQSAQLDWHAFCAAYFPGRRRHDFEALTAYGSYRRSQAVDERSAEEVVRKREPTNGAAGSSALQGWEGEGGAAL